jgi:hypothetical protein
VAFTPKTHYYTLNDPRQCLVIVLKITIATALSLLYLHISTAAAVCGAAEAGCIQPNGHAKIHTEALSTERFTILPSSVNTTQSKAGVKQSRALLTRDRTAQVAKSGQRDLLLDNRFAVSKPEKAPVDFYGINKNIDSDKLIGVYMRGKLPVADTLKLSGTVGYTHATFATGEGRELTNDSDLSYGLGTELQMTEDLSLSMDYIQLIDRPEVEHTGISLGLEGRF